MIGQTISHYKILEHLGGGGMGVVYKATDPIRRMDVAIKVLRGRLSSDDDRWRFQREVELHRALRHPGIVWLIYGGLASVMQSRPDGSGFDQRPYFVMEYVRGRPLVSHGLDGAIRVVERSLRRRTARMATTAAPTGGTKQRGPSE